MERTKFGWKRWLMIVIGISLGLALGIVTQFIFWTIRALIQYESTPGFLDTFNYGISWIIISVATLALGLFTIVMVLFSWRKKPKEASKKDSITKGDARWQEGWERVLSSYPTFETEMSASSIDGIVVGQDWIKKSAVPEIKAKLFELRSLIDTNQRSTKRDLGQLVSKLGTPSMQTKIETWGLKEKYNQILELQAQQNYSKLSKEIDFVMSKLGINDAIDSKYAFCISDKAKENAARAGIEDELEKAINLYDAKKTKEFMDQWKLIAEKIVLDATQDEVFAKADEVLKLVKTFKSNEIQSLGEELTKAKKRGDLVRMDELEVEIKELILLEESSKSTKNKSKTTQIQNDAVLTKLAKQIYNLIKANKVEVQVSADGKTSFKPRKVTETEILYWKSNNGLHSVIIGSTGSGKTVAVINPTIDYFASSANKPSLIISDVKGELFQKRSKFLSENGYNVVALNFNDAKNSSKWNPLDVARDAYEKAIVAKLEQRIVDSADYESIMESSLSELKSAMFNPAGSKEPFWVNSAGNVFLGLTWFLLEMYGEGYEQWYKSNPNEAKRVWPEGWLNKNCLNLSYIRRMAQYTNDGQIDFFGKKSDSTIKLFFKHNEAFRAKRKSYGYLSSTIFEGAQETIGSIMQTFEERMAPFEDGIVKGITLETTLPLENIANEPTAVFMIIPDQKQAYNFFGSLFVSQVYQKLVEVSNRNNNMQKQKVHFLLDEFGNFPAIANFSSMITVARSRGIRFHVVLQDYSQLSKIYGNEDAKIIRGNLDLTVYLLTTDVQTAREISDKIGQKTVVQENVSKSSGGKGGTSTSKSESISGEPLIRPEQLMRQKLFTGLTLSSRQFPTKTEFIPYYLDKNVAIRESNGIVTLGTTQILEGDWVEKYSVDLKALYKKQVHPQTSNEVKEAKGFGQRRIGDKGAVRSRPILITNLNQKDFIESETIKMENNLKDIKEVDPWDEEGGE